MASEASEDKGLVLLKKRHEKFLLRLLDILPGDSFGSLETSRMTLVFFIISGLDVLGRLEAISAERKAEIIDWIYSLQVGNGFVGSTFGRFECRDKCEGTCTKRWSQCTHIAMTYTALATLVTLGDDLSRLNRAGLKDGLRSLQTRDGAFMASLEDDEKDMRFVFCAAAICRLIGDDFSAVNADAMFDYIMKSQTYDGAFGQGPGLEAHGGSTYCAVAALCLMGRLAGCVRERCARWCALRLHEGFQGRPNKHDDTCYTFWVGAALCMLTDGSGIGPELVARCAPYVLSTQDAVTGGLAKMPEHAADPLHTFLGISGLALSGHAGLAPVEPSLNITRRAASLL